MEINGSGACDWYLGIKEELVLDQERARKCEWEKRNQ